MRRAAEAGLVLCLIGGVLVMALFGPGSLPIVKYHYERDLSSVTASRFKLIVSGFEDCWLDISIRDDPNLVYEVDLELYNRGIDEDDFSVGYSELEGQGTLKVQAGNYLYYARKITIVLGNSLPLSISVFGKNLTSSIVLSNNAILDDDSTIGIGYSYGSLSLRFAENLNITGYVKPHIFQIEAVNLTVNL
ncbi:MAG: hypothetical protein ACFFAY_01610, partial [Promethearchaeota archaeon]